MCPSATRRSDDGAGAATPRRPRGRSATRPPHRGAGREPRARHLQHPRQAPRAAEPLPAPARAPVRGAISGTLADGEETGWKLAWSHEGEIVTCPWHSLEFHVPTGQCVALPDIKSAHVRGVGRDGETECLGGDRSGACRARHGRRPRPFASAAASRSCSREHGADVVINDAGHRRGSRPARGRGRGARPSRCFVSADVSSPAENDRLIAETVERIGRLDTFVANAGLARWQTARRRQRADWDLLMGVNLHGVFNSCRAAAAQMRDKGAAGASSSPHRCTRDAVRDDERLWRHEARGRAPRRSDGARVGGRPHRRQPRRPRLGGLEINDTSPDFDTEEEAPGRARSRSRTGRASLRRWARPSPFSSPTRWRNTGVYVRVDGGLVIGKY